jgi:hypothetical protein
MGSGGTPVTVYKAAKLLGLVLSVVVGLYVAVVVYRGLAYVKDGLEQDGALRGRARGRSALIVLGAPPLAGIFVGLAAWGLAVTCLKPIEWTMRWSIYRLNDDGQRLSVASDLSFNDMTIRRNQMENREPSARFESVPG